LKLLREKKGIMILLSTIFFVVINLITATLALSTQKTDPRLADFKKVTAFGEFLTFYTNKNYAEETRN
jgi:hypothetical protein